MQRKGIILAGGTGSRLHPITLGISKQILPVYDKPMIYYPLSVLMLADIREILIISTPHDLPVFQKLLGTGEQFGLQFSYAEQAEPEGLAQAFTIGEAFLAGAPACLILGDNLFFSNELQRTLHQVNVADSGSHIFAYHVSDPARYGVVEFDHAGKVLSIEEKPQQPKSSFAIPGLYFFDETAPERVKQQQLSPRGELEITDLIKTYLTEQRLEVALLGRGTAWLDTGTHESLLEASQFVHTIQNRQGLMVACLEEIAWKKKWIDHATIQKQIDTMGKSTYANYLHQLIKT